MKKPSSKDRLQLWRREFQIDELLLIAIMASFMLLAQ